MNRIEEEFAEFDRTAAWGFVYERIRNESTLNREFEYTTKEARKGENRSRNRYRDVSPYDHSRVYLNGENDYINASLVLGEVADRRYILTQGPLPHTSGHFWQMVWEQNSRAVVMLNRVIEKGTIKCSQYFPIGEENGGQENMFFQDVNIKVTYMGERKASYYTVRTLEVENVELGETKQVLQFHYTTWPDFGVPQSAGAFINFLMAVRMCGGLDNDVGPAIIHCSAGIGRSGTFCLVDTCLIVIEKTKDPNQVDIREILLDMRKYRMGLIQTADQLRFSYLAVIEGAKRILDNTLYSGIDESAANSTAQGHSLEEEDLTDDLPPPPPRRTTSLTPPENGLYGAYLQDPLLSSTYGFNENSEDETPPPLPPRRTKPSPDSAPEDILMTDRIQDSQGENQTEVRRRKREERKKNTAEQVARMKQKQQEHEKWQLRRVWVRPVYIGLALLAGGFLLYRYYFTS